MARIPWARSLHDIGLAAWFGGTLNGAIGVNGAAADVDDPRQRARVANAGWARWTPVNAAAIAAHLVGGALIVAENKPRIAGQKGVAGWTLGKTALTGTALAATGYSGLLRSRIRKAGDVPVDGGTAPNEQTPADVANAQRQLAVLQWLIPALTGSIVVAQAFMGEQQRPADVTKGAAQRVAQAVVVAAKHPVATAHAAGKAVTD